MLTASGILAQRQPELRLLLKDVDLSVDRETTNWPERIRRECAVAFALLARKSGPWSDVDASLESLLDLAEIQREIEPGFLTDAQDVEEAHLLGLYHLAEALIVTGRYLRSGAVESIEGAIQRHCEHARSLLHLAGEVELHRVVDTAEAALVSMVRASIWSSTRRLSQAARDFVQTLTNTDGRDPISELWWSQREALSQSLLDPYKLAVSVQMPTSAGKTLLAEFSIIQALALNPGGTVAYVVPTRALVNQITRRLRADLEGARSGEKEVTVEAAVPVFELDPTEEALLSVMPSVLVTTPEKLDLLIRSRHPSVAHLSLVVVDEAHHIADKDRGARLELLLTTIKREQGQACRFLLLTPFLPNAPDLARWLGGTDGAAISLDWTPSEQLRALGHWQKRKGTFNNVLSLLPSVTQSAHWQGKRIQLGPSLLQPRMKGRPAISTALAAGLAQRSGGGSLVLTRGPGTSETRALDIAEALGDPAVGAEPSELMSAALEYIRAELGAEYPLVKSLSRGVAFHHAGLPPEVRALVELLLERGDVSVVAGTSTLAQGVNFPLASVVIESLKVAQGRGKPYRPLRFEEFWNIAGRAGRAMQDPIGLVVYPSAGPQDDKLFKEYLAGEAMDVVSALANVFATLDDSSDFGLKLVRDSPAMGHFLQFLTHALRVAGHRTASAEVEEMLRSSLVFNELRQSGERDTAEKLVRWSRRFLDSAKTNSLVSVADVTGFSLPSVGRLAAGMSGDMSETAFWMPDNLFGDDLEPLTGVVELLAELPEMSLSPNDEAGPLNAHRVAGVVRDWVRGLTLPEIAENWFPEDERRLTSTGRYLFRDLAGQIPWGIGAMQLVGAGRVDASQEGVLARQVPAMAYYGVSEPSALALRMVGVPRVAAEGLGRIAPEFESFAEARKWVATVSPDTWNASVLSGRVSGEVVARVWEAVGGTST